MTTPSRQHYRQLYQTSRRNSERNQNLLTKGLISEAKRSSEPGQETRRKGKQRGTTVNIKSCNAQFCDPGWEPYPNIVSTVNGYNILKGNAYNLGTDQVLALKRAIYLYQL